jgi:phosphoserine phosphatase RsbU/P
MQIDYSKIKILIVDDEVDLEALIFQKFRHRIRNNEYHFIFANNGLEALSMLIKYSDISIIITDINMPDMDGLTLLLKVKELKDPLLKTVVISAYSDMDNIRTAMNRGAFDFIVKPINFNDLEITIDKTIEEIQIQRNAIKEHDELLSLQQDLSVAREIQHAILLKDFPPFPGRKDFDLYATMIAAKEVGGDFYDFFMIDDDRFAIVIGDVSGKGIPAAIFMAVSRTIIRATGLKGTNPGDCLNYVNNLLCSENNTCMFVTVFYGIMNMKTGVLEYSNAGHNPPYILRNNGAIELLGSTGNIILAAISEYKFDTNSVQLNPKDALLLFTDGVTEAYSEQGKIYGEKRLEKLLRSIYNLPTNMIIDSIVADVNQFSEGMPQFDDITMLILKYFG